MTAAEIVAHLRGLDVRLHADGERLRCSAPKGVLTEEMREQLSSRKGEILAWLREHEGAGPDATGREPLAFAQQRLWFMDQLSPGGFAYNITGGLRIAGRLNVEALERALGELVRRHEPLRTVFVAIDGQPVQVVNPVAEFRLPVLDLQSTPAAEREADGQRRMIQEGQRPFDLGRGPLHMTSLSPFQTLRSGLTPRPPSVLPEGTWEARLTESWANLWAYNEDDILIDMEILHSNFALGCGLGQGWRADLELEMSSRFGGSMDGLINSVHDLLGAETRHREDFPNDDFQFDLDEIALF